MSAQANAFYEFGPFRIDPADRVFLRDGNTVPLTAKAFDTLLLLVQRGGHLVEKAEIIQAVWPDSFVEEGNLKVVICALRKILEDDVGEPKYIQTVSKHGYRFVAQVRPVLIASAGSRLLNVEPAPAASVSSLSKRMTRWWSTLQTASLAVILLVIVAGGLYFGRSRLDQENAQKNSDEIHSLAVLPFQALNVDDDKKYLGLGIADAVITRLGSTGQIIVRPTSSVAKYVQTFSDPSTIGREQKVDAVLEGNIEVASNRIRVSVQLVRARDGFLLWADTFTERPEQIFALEEAVAERVVKSVPVQLSGPAQERLERVDTQDSKAYSLYLYGRYLLNKRTAESIRQSINYFQQSIAEDNRYALAYADLAGAYVLLGSYGEPPEQMYPLARKAALKAVELDDSLQAAHASLAMVAFHYEWRWPDAEREFKTAITLNPNEPLVRAWYGQYLAAMGRNQEAIDQAEQAQELDPVSPVVNTSVDRTLYWNREYDKAIEGYRRVITLEPGFSITHTRLGVAYLAKLALPDAISEFEKAQQLDPDPYVEGLLGYAQARSGNTSAARELVEGLIKKSRRQYVPAFSIALVYIGLGERDRALDWLERSYQDHSTYMVYAKTDSLLDPVRSDPRFVALMRQMGL